MCNNYASKVPANRIADAFSATGFPLRFDGGVIPNLEPRDDIRIGDAAPIVTWDDGPILKQMKWAWKSLQGRPVFNFRSDGRSFANSTRCLIPADGFYEFTDAEPGQKRKTKWSFTMIGEEWFWIAGIVKDGAWAMLTTEPGPDIAPYHDRQIVVLDQARGADWLNLVHPEDELLKPSAAGALTVEKVFP
ncbi:MAG: SOS response-associated peptidase family protein [Parvibaculum sp.]